MRKKYTYTLMAMISSTLFLLFTNATSVNPKIFYVDNIYGDDYKNDGLSSNRPFKSLARLNSMKYVEPGSKILFKRGGVWRGVLKPLSGSEDNPVTYGSYGIGQKPRLYGSFNLSRTSEYIWEEKGSNIWTVYLKAIGGSFDGYDHLDDVGNLIFSIEGASTYGQKKFSKENLLRQGDFYYSTSEKSLSLYSIENPQDMYLDIEAALSIHIIKAYGVQNLVIDGLDLRYTGYHAFNAINTQNVTIKDCEFYWIGGGYFKGSKQGYPVRFGNAVQFWGSNRNAKVIKNKFWQIYDTPVTAQSKAIGTKITNIDFSYNLMGNFGFAAFELWSTNDYADPNLNYGNSSEAIIQNVSFSNNTVLFAGKGFGSRPSELGYGVHFTKTSSKVENVLISNNIFHSIERDALAFYDLSDWYLTTPLD